jgi:hypothetical protein
MRQKDQRAEGMDRKEGIDRTEGMDRTEGIDPVYFFISFERWA